MKREKVMVKVLDIDSNDLPSRLDEVATVFQAAWDAVPEEYRAEMSFYKWGEVYYDAGSCHFEAYYLRPETDEEMASRAQREADDRFRAEERERAALAALKAKYGG